MWLLRVGLLGPVPTLGALGQPWACTRERIRQHEQRGRQSFSVTRCRRCEAEIRHVAQSIVQTARVVTGRYLDREVQARALAALAQTHRARAAELARQQRVREVQLRALRLRARPATFNEAALGALYRP